jgi:hypothetical protein
MFQYMANRWLRVTSTYTSPSPSYNLTFESSANGTTWTSRGSWTNISSYLSRRIFNTTDVGSDSYIRITMQNTHATAAVPLSNIELLSARAGDQGGDTTGIEGNLPLDWDGARAITIQPKRSDSVPLTIRNRVAQSASISGATSSGGVTTYTIAVGAQYPFQAGETVLISGIVSSVNTGGTANTGFNVGQAVITSATNTSFTISRTVAETYTSGGSVKVSGLNNLLQWFNGDGFLLGYITSGGQLNITNNSSAGINITGAGSFVASSGGLPAIRIQQATGQSADLFEFRNAAYSTVLGSMAADATLKFPALTSQTASKALLTTNGDTGGFLITTVSDANKGLVIKGTASQTANLQEWQDSAGSAMVRISPGGDLLTAGIGSFGSYVNAGILNAQGYTTTQITSVFKAVASQTADITQWQNSSGAVLSRIRPGGQIGIGSAITGTALVVNTDVLGASTIGMIIRGAASQTGELINLQSSDGTTLLRINAQGQVEPLSTAGQAFTIKGVASQTLDLQQWQNSSGAVLAKIDKDGNFKGRLVYDINAQTGTTYSFALTDAASIVTLSNSNVITASIPTDASVDFPIGSTITIIQTLDGQVTIQAATSGTTIVSSNALTANAPKLRGVGSSATLIKTSANNWYVIGDLY